MAVARYHAEDQYLETFTELQHYLIISKILPLRITFKHWHTATRTHSILIVRLPAFKSKLIFWEYQDSQFLTLPSLGGSHHCVAACRAEWYGVLYLVVSCTYLLKRLSYAARPPRHQRWTLYSACSIPQAFLSRSNLGKEAIPRAPRYKIFFLRGDKIAY